MMQFYDSEGRGSRFAAESAETNAETTSKKKEQCFSQRAPEETPYGAGGGGVGSLLPTPS